MIKDCLICNNKFEGSNSFKYCSDECRKEKRKVKQKDYNDKNKEHIREYKKSYYKTYIKCNKEKIRSIKNCLVCNNEFEGIASSKYCSEECRKEQRSRRYESYCESNKGGVKKCLICGKDFEDNAKSRYCSKKCYDKFYNKVNVERKKEYGRIKYNINKEKITLYQRERQKDYQKAYREINKESKKVYNKLYREANKERINRSRIKYNREHRKIRYHTDHNYRLITNLRSTVRRVLKENKIGKRTKDFIDYNMQELKNHLESLWQEGMSWENYNYYGWHMDHIRPISSFNFFNEDGSIYVEEVKKCMSLKNLQPLWWEDNLRKSNKILGEKI